MPKAFFHAKIFDGGLGMVTLEHQVPMMKIKHIDRLWASNDPVIWEMLSTDGAESLLAERCRSRTGKASGLPLRLISTPPLTEGAYAKATLFPINIVG